MERVETEFRIDCSPCCARALCDDLPSECSSAGPSPQRCSTSIKRAGHTPPRERLPQPYASKNVEVELLELESCSISSDRSAILCSVPA